MTDYHAIVVGAGPAGSTAAHEIASKGFKTLVLERQKVVASNIACAEGITDFWFQALGWEPKQIWISAHVNDVRVYGPAGDFFETHVGHVGYVLERRVFDRDLALRAGLAGADILTGASFVSATRQASGFLVEFKSRGQTHRVSGKVLVGADGPASAVAKSLGVELDVPIADIHYTAQVHLVSPDLSGDWLGLYAGNQIAPAGYGWCFPKGPGFANVGVGVAHRSKRVDPVPYLDEFLSRYFPKSTRVGRVLSVVPTGGHRLKPYADGFVAVGDAARLADPMTGGGLGPAILSGSIAGKVIAEALEAGDTSEKRLSEYPKRYWRAVDRKSYELSYNLRDAYFDFTDEDFEYLFKELKPVFHEAHLESVDSMDIGRTVLSKAPGVAKLAVKKGKNALFKYLRATLFGR